MMFRVMGLAAAIASIVLMMAAAMLPWADMDGTTKVGPIPVSLDADLMEYGIDYTADLGNLSDSSLFSGLGNKIPSKMEGNKVFLTGLGEFQETIGFVKGTSKEKIIKVSSYTWPPPQNGTAVSKITTYVKTIPWWPVGLGQDVGMKVELTEAYNISELKVLKVWFELQLPAKGNETPKHRTVWELSPGDSLKNAGESRTYKGTAVVDGDYGEFAVLGYVQLELQDAYGHSNKKTGGGYYEDNPGAREIRLWTMSPDRTAKIALMASAFPLTITGAILLAAGAAMGFLGTRRPRLARWSWKICLGGCVLTILAVPFYMMGVNALVDLAGYASWLRWRPVFWLAVVGACLPVLPTIMYFIVRPPPAPRPPAPKPKDRQNDQATGQERGQGQSFTTNNLKKWKSIVRKEEDVPVIR
jgi:hypothetical protein